MLPVLAFAAIPAISFAQTNGIYKKGWIDFNKNGKKDLYEDPAQPVEKRTWPAVIYSLISFS